MDKVICRFCGTSNGYKGSYLCDSCWEIDVKIRLSNMPIIELCLKGLGYELRKIGGTK